MARYAHCAVCGVKATKKGNLLYTRPSNGKELNVFSYYFVDRNSWNNTEKEVEPNTDGVTPVYVCPNCSNIQSYHVSTSYGNMGTLNKDGIKFGCEFESNGHTPETVKKALKALGFILEHDGSLRGDGMEAVSRIYSSLNSLGKYLPKMYEIGFRTDSECGTHVNLSIDSAVMSYDKQRKAYNYIRRFYNSIFADLSTWMVTDGKDIVKEVFGRNINTWCKAITNDSTPATSHNSSRYYWINTEHTTEYTTDKALRLEIRLPLWNTDNDADGQKFLNTIRCCRALYSKLMSIKDLDNEFSNASAKRDYCKELGNELKAIMIKYATTKQIY